MGQNYFTSGQVALRAGTSRPHLQYLVESGKIPGPSLQVPGRWLFNEEDVQQIIAILDKTPSLRGRCRTEDDSPRQPV